MMASEANADGSVEASAPFVIEPVRRILVPMAKTVAALAIPSAPR
jgi:hypothetical protein